MTDLTCRSMRRWQRLLAAMGCLTLLPALAVPAAAAETTLDCTYVTITGDGFVADTMNGVDALYNLNGPTLYCVDLVLRYYEEVYGLELRCTDGAPVVLNNDDLYFAETDSPKPGDVLYGSAAARDKSYNHWALVKSCDGETMTLFEQNWRWNGQAGVDREIAFPNDCYVAYTLCSRSGAEITPVEGSVAIASEWAATYLAQAEENGIATLETDFQSSVTRADFCQMALNVLAAYGVEAEGETVLEQAADAGLVDADAEDKVLNRQEVAVISSRLLEALGQTPEGEEAVLDGYTDSGDIADWAREAVAQMVACGLMSGSEGRFDPLGAMTNEQAVALMVRIYDNPSPSLLYQSGKADSRRAAAISTVARCAGLDVVALGAGDMMLSRALRPLR